MEGYRKVVSLIEIFIAFLIIAVIGVILYSFGRTDPRKSEESPYASGEKYPSIKISYRTVKLFYAALFSVIDAAAILLAFIGSLGFDLRFIGFWLLIGFSLLLIAKLRRE